MEGERGHPFHFYAHSHLGSRHRSFSIVKQSKDDAFHASSPRCNCSPPFTCAVGAAVSLPLPHNPRRSVYNESKWPRRTWDGDDGRAAAPAFRLHVTWAWLGWTVLRRARQTGLGSACVSPTGTDRLDAQSGGKAPSPGPVPGPVPGPGPGPLRPARALTVHNKVTTLLCLPSLRPAGHGTVPSRADTQRLRCLHSPPSSFPPPFSRREPLRPCRPRRRHPAAGPVRDYNSECRLEYTSQILQAALHTHTYSGAEQVLAACGCKASPYDGGQREKLGCGAKTRPEEEGVRGG